MTLPVYDLMQRAVDIVGTSPHPTNKIAATLGLGDYHISYTNEWPGPIATHIGTQTKIGNASGTVHAETACILEAPHTDGASLFVTDVPCPNCIKNMAEAGIKALYIDHKGFDKDFALRRGHLFESMAMRICEKAGISVYKIFRKDKKTETILAIPEAYKPPLEKPPHVEALIQPPSKSLFENCIAKESKKFGGVFALAFAHDTQGTYFMISAEPHPAIGYTTDTIEKPEDKYNFLLEPVNRVLMTAARQGLFIDKNYIYCSRVPTARELVNIVASGITRLHIGDRNQARDNDAHTALDQLEKAGILNVE
jgi:deoxycytidylate deaminase